MPEFFRPATGAFLLDGRSSPETQPPEGFNFTENQRARGVSFDQFWRGVEDFGCLGEFPDLIPALLDGELECLRVNSLERQWGI